MSDGELPQGNIAWTEIKASSDRRWAVEELTHAFVSHLVAEKDEEGDWVSPRKPDSRVVFWESRKAKSAQRWLLRESQKDANSWKSCGNCGKHMHANKAPDKEFCSVACRKFSERGPDE